MRVSYFPLKRISPAKIFFRAFMDREEVEVNKNANTDQGQSSAIMNEQAWSVKYSTLSPERQPFPCGNIAGNPRRPRCAQLARSGGQSQWRIHFILPAHGFSHTKTSVHSLTCFLHRNCWKCVMCHKGNIVFCRHTQSSPVRKEDR